MNNTQLLMEPLSGSYRSGAEGKAQAASEAIDLFIANDGTFP